jgi:hypothetical protein
MLVAGPITSQGVNLDAPALSIPALPFDSGHRCDQSQFDIPYRHSFKIAGNYPLPLGLMVGTSIVSTPVPLSVAPENGSCRIHRS